MSSQVVQAVRRWENRLVPDKPSENRFLAALLQALAPFVRRWHAPIAVVIAASCALAAPAFALAGEPGKAWKGVQGALAYGGVAVLTRVAWRRRDLDRRLEVEAVVPRVARQVRTVLILLVGLFLVLPLIVLVASQG